MARNRERAVRAFVTAIAVIPTAGWQDARAQGSEGEAVIEEIVVTGTFIRGTSIDSTSPVDVTTRDEIEGRGIPSVLDLIQSLGPVSGVEGRTNQFQAAGREGTATINLRGLGPERTLVLLNDQRLASTAENYVNISAVPVVALERIELLKDGASATYGSDAIAGVANFITRSDFRGIELSGAARDMDGAEDPNWEAGLIAGLGTDRFDLVASFGYEFRSRVPNRDKDWVLQPAEVNPAGGISFLGNPGTYIPFPPTNFQFLPDPDCETVGGKLGADPRVEAPFCFFRYTDFDNLQEEEDHYQFFLESNYQLTNRLALRAELLYAKDDVANWQTSPSYPNNSLVDTDRIVVPGMPHFDDFLNRNPDLASDLSTGALVWGRIRGVSGPAETGTRESDSYRVSAGLTWDPTEDLSVTGGIVYARNERQVSTFDTRIDNLAWAYRGLGGPDCDVASGIPGSGNIGDGDCYYYNPFTSAFRVSQAAGFEGVPSPGGDNPQLNNPDWLNRWLTAPAGDETTTEMVVVDLVASWQSGLEFQGGKLALAAGMQYRNDDYDRQPNRFSDSTVTPCAFDLEASGDSFTIPPIFLPQGGVVPPYTYTCSGAGPFHFLASAAPFQDDQDVGSVFAEVALPLTDRLDVQLALRYEDYGAEHGDTLDPKIAARWDLLDTVSLRASYSSAFRAPPVSRRGGLDTFYVFVPPPVGGFRPADVVGNPELEPEEADTLNVGIIWQPTDNLYASLDYWRFEFQDPVVQENAVDVVQSLLDPTSPAHDEALEKVDFSAPGVIDRISLTYVNGPDTDTDGIDYLIRWDAATALGLITLGARGTYINSYEVDEWIWAAGYDGEGHLNAARSALPLPQWKNNLYVNWLRGRHNVRFDLWHVDDYDDDRPVIGASVDEQVTADVHYSFIVNGDRTRVFASVYNITDEDPPLARLDLSYDPYTHNPFGRVIKVGITHRLEFGPFR